MTALGQLQHQFGTFMAVPIKVFQYRFRVTASRQEQKREDIRYTRNTLAWITTFGSGLTPNQYCLNGFLPSTFKPPDATPFVLFSFIDPQSWCLTLRHIRRVGCDDVGNSCVEFLGFHNAQSRVD